MENCALSRRLLSEKIRVCNDHEIRSTQGKRYIPDPRSVLQSVSLTLAVSTDQEAPPSPRATHVMLLRVIQKAARRTLAEENFG